LKSVTQTLYIKCDAVAYGVTLARWPIDREPRTCRRTTPWRSKSFIWPTNSSAGSTGAWLVTLPRRPQGWAV